MIATTTWYQGGMTYLNGHSATAKVAYNYELGDNKVVGTFIQDCDGYDSGTTMCEYDAKTDAQVGLMYISEYYYAASPTYWSYKGYDTATTDYRSATSSNWMYTGVNEWAITRYVDGTSSSNNSFLVEASGYVRYYSAFYTSQSVRPTFNLESSVTYVSGTGTKIDPYRVSL